MANNFFQFHWQSSLIINNFITFDDDQLFVHTEIRSQNANEPCRTTNIVTVINMDQLSSDANYVLYPVDDNLDEIPNDVMDAALQLLDENNEDGLVDESSRDG